MFEYEIALFGSFELQRVLDNLDEERAGARLSGLSVERRYDWRDITEATLAVYTSVVSRRRTRLRWLNRKDKSTM